MGGGCGFCIAPGSASGWSAGSSDWLTQRQRSELATQREREKAKARGFDKLEYSPGLFWQNAPGGALHHPDFWDVISSRVVVHRASITSMSHHRLHLSNKTVLDCDALLLGTGLSSSLTFMSDSLKLELDLPHDPAIEAPDSVAKWKRLHIDAEEAVLRKFPILDNPPKHNLKRARTTPYRLYRGIAPINDPSRSIVFINFWLCGNMIMNAEAQAIWAVAYLSGQQSLYLPSREKQEARVAMQVAWSRRRYLSVGQLGNFSGFDLVSYVDVLLRDIGVEGSWRARGAWGVRRPADLGLAWKELLEKRHQK